MLIALSGLPKVYTQEYSCYNNGYSSDDSVPVPVLGHITSDGTITELDFSPPNSPPISSGQDTFTGYFDDMTVDARGNFWVIQEDAAYLNPKQNTILEITPDGNVIDKLSFPDIWSTHIVAGPDGNLWVASEGPSESGIGFFSPYRPDAITVLPVGANSTRIIIDADHNLWGAGGDRIFRITP